VIVFADRRVLHRNVAATLDEAYLLIGPEPARSSSGSDRSVVMAFGGQ
jgi:hypothetical protein